ncbi:MAG: hypothetical protein H7647_06275 [Candidatus Heimdallarchaeota archaeon]|nr:hypothetical protein [Candidatus Heimdallarchaeota archaeon]
MVSTDNLPYNRLRDIYQTVFMIQKILIVHHETSLPIFEKDVEYTIPFDSSMITGILEAISIIGQEMIGRPTGFKKLEFHGFVVSGSHFNGFTIYIFSETDLEKEIEKGMQKLISWFSTAFRSIKDNWDGSLDIFEINKAIIENKISQDLYLWLLYPLQTSKNKQLDIEHLSIFGRTIFECVDKNESCTSARLLDYFKQFDEEEILNEIFGLVDKGYLVTSSND